MDKFSVNEQKVHLNVRRPTEFNIETKVAFDLAYKQKLQYEKKATAGSPNQSLDFVDFAEEVDIENCTRK